MHDAPRRVSRRDRIAESQTNGRGRQTKPRKYNIKKTDKSLKAIAAKLLGKASSWHEIVKLNPHFKPKLRGFKITEAMHGKTLLVPITGQKQSGKAPDHHKGGTKGANITGRHKPPNEMSPTVVKAPGKGQSGKHSTGKGKHKKSTVVIPSLSVVRRPRADFDVAGLKLQGKTISAKLSQAITDGSIATTIEGASTLSITVSDWYGSLLRSELLTGLVTLDFDRRELHPRQNLDRSNYDDADV